MRFSLLLGLALLTTPVSARVSTCLQAALDDAEAGDYLTVNVRLHDRLDVEKLSLLVEHLPRAARRAAVLRAAQDLARHSQEPVRAFLADFEDDGTVMEIRPLWVTNELNILAQPHVIEYLNIHSSVARIGLDRTRPWQELVDLAEASPQEDAPNALWNLEMIEAPSAWARGYEGQGVIVANVDTGVYRDHADYADRIWVNIGEIEGNRIDDDGNGRVDDTWGWNFDSNDNNPGYQSSSHGTNTSGIMVGDGTDGTVTGVAPRGSLMAIRSCSSEFNARSAYQYALANGADVLSSSCSYKYYDCPDYAAFRQLGELEAAAGLFHTNSVGNTRDYSSTPVPYNISAPGHQPSAFLHPDQGTGGTAGVQGCGAVGSNGAFKDYSGEGPSEYESGAPSCGPQFEYDDYPWPADGCIKPDYAAPTDVMTTKPYGGYTSGFSGTSAATPHSGGVAAVILSAVPDATPAEVSEAMQMTADDRGASGKDNDYGAGILDVSAAVNYLIKDLTVAITPPVNTVVSGEAMAFTVEVHNNIGRPRTTRIVVNLYLENGTPYSGNPLYRSPQFTLPGGAALTRNMQPVISGPEGLYTVGIEARVAGETISRDTFRCAVR